MIDMGLEEPVKKILDCIPSTHATTHARITHLFSATFPTPLEALAKSITQNPAIICIGKPGSGVKDITQKVVMVSQETKRANLIKLLNDSTPPIIVFLNQKKDADSVRNIIESMGHVFYSYSLNARLFIPTKHRKRERAPSADLKKEDLMCLFAQI
jgi:superfamily II DNA/RNA helicase